MGFTGLERRRALCPGDEAQVITSLLAQYVERMGVNQAVLGAASIASFEGDVFIVPLQLAKQMGIVNDRLGYTTFRIEQHAGRASALFDFSMKNKNYSGSIFCARGHRYLAVQSNSNGIPSAFSSMQATQPLSEYG